MDTVPTPGSNPYASGPPVGSHTAPGARRPIGTLILAVVFLLSGLWLGWQRFSQLLRNLPDCPGIDQLALNRLAAPARTRPGDASTTNLLPFSAFRLPRKSYSRTTAHVFFRWRGCHSSVVLHCPGARRLIGGDGNGCRNRVADGAGIRLVAVDRACVLAIVNSGLAPSTWGNCCSTSSGRTASSQRLSRGRHGQRLVPLDRTVPGENESTVLLQGDRAPRRSEPCGVAIVPCRCVRLGRALARDRKIVVDPDIWTVL